MHHLTVSIRAFDRPYVLPCFYRAGLARRYSSLPARWLVVLLRSLLMTTIIIRKSTFPLWVSLRRYGRSHSPRSSRIIGHSDFSYSRVFSDPRNDAIIGEDVLCCLLAHLNRIALHEMHEFDRKLREIFFYCALRDDTSRL